VTDDGAEADVVLSVIIPTYNARDLLADCLQSIYRNPPSEPYEIIVVDDASADQTSAMVQAGFPEVRLLRNEVNQHYAFSNNRAIKQARGQFLYLLNNDTIVLPQALDRMIAFRTTPRCRRQQAANGDGTIVVGRGRCNLLGAVWRPLDHHPDCAQQSLFAPFAAFGVAS
jgi:glycosyltransferase involved in cell wall biosynthesis